MSKIEIKNVYKIFGDQPSKVLPMVQDGATKEEILEKTGHTVGLDNVSLSIEEGETFVCMGLSGSGKSTLIRHINRLIDPTSGVVSVEGTNVMDLDPKGLIEAKKQLPAEVDFCQLLDNVFDGADALIIMTEWNVYRGLNLQKVKEKMQGNILIDLRNIYERESVEKVGFRYFCVGR